MNTKTCEILTAVLRCAIATENHKTNEILTNFPWAIVPVRDKFGKVTSAAKVVDEYDFVTDPNVNADFSERHAVSFKTINSFFFKTSSPVVKQAYRYLSIPDNRPKAVLKDMDEKKYSLFEEIYSMVFAHNYMNNFKCINYKNDIDKINFNININLNKRLVDAGCNDLQYFNFRPLLKIIDNDLQKYNSIEEDVAPKGNNTILNYLNPFTLAEYYFYRKTINDYYYKNCERPMYNSTPAKMDLLKEALSTQIYNPFSTPKEYHKPFFRNRKLEGLVTEPIDHIKAKKIVDDIMKNDPKCLEDIPALINNLLCNNFESTRDECPNFYVDSTSIVDVNKDSGRNPKYKIRLSTKEGNVATAANINESQNIKHYLKEKENRDEIESFRNSTQTSLFG